MAKANSFLDARLAHEARAALASAKRIVVKIGTATITRQKGQAGRISDGPDPGGSGIDVEFLHRVAAELADLARDGRQPVLVTSGAVGMGARALGLEKKPKDTASKQACAAIGQPLLMEEYRRAFDVFGLTAAQLLVTREAWEDREAYLNLRSTVEALLERRAVPVFNENDSVSTAEIAFGDNDRLSAYVASKIDADLLVILSDVDALYDADPRTDPGARPIPFVREIDPAMMSAAGGKGSEFSTGGMRTKLMAVAIARDAGCRVALVHGRSPRIISRVIAGEAVGTLFDADAALRNRQRWIKRARPKGEIAVDDGALAAMRERRSLLPCGVVSVSGTFERGDVVLIGGAAMAVTSLSSVELEAARGKRSSELGGRDGTGGSRVVARPDDVVFLD
ncbi:MAG TPA: glutamate 5-kinase [Spirochaetales bacterium]|nr:glutamate 5-kinase [Spirochaetales bacterium]